MKNLLFFLLLVFLGVVSCKTGSNQQDDETQEQVSINPENVVLIDMDVSGMTCTGCENTIKSGVSELAGIVMVDASYTGAKTYVKVDTSLTSLEEIAQAISSKGYKVEGSSMRKADMEDTGSAIKE